MLKPKTLSLTVTTETRLYNVHWWGSADDGLFDILITVETTEPKSDCTATERFEITGEDTSWDIDNLTNLKAWFYNEFAYQYADLHRNDSTEGCTWASILYDLGNYTVVRDVKEKEENTTELSTEELYNEETSLFYVSINDDDPQVYAFTHFDHAEQWANERLYLNETVDASTNRPPYTIFTIWPKSMFSKHNTLDLPSTEN